VLPAQPLFTSHPATPLILTVSFLRSSQPLFASHPTVPSIFPQLFRILALPSATVIHITSSDSFNQHCSFSPIIATIICVAFNSSFNLSSIFLNPCVSSASDIHITSNNSFNPRQRASGDPAGRCRRISDPANSRAFSPTFRPLVLGCLSGLSTVALTSQLPSQLRRLLPPGGRRLSFLVPFSECEVAGSRNRP
jgi:hypothetical protein